MEEMYVPHPIVGAIDKNPEQGTVLFLCYVAEVEGGEGYEHSI